MIQNTEEYINLLISLEPIFKQAGDLALKLRSTAKASYKSETGVHGVDLVTEADLAVQEMILSAMVKTKLIECKIIAEENTPSVAKFKGSNGLTLTIDPIDGTFIYTSNGRFFSIIVCLNDGQSLLYTYTLYPAVDWARRIANSQVQDFGILPKVKTKDNLDLTKTIASSFRDPAKTVPEVYAKLVTEGYIFRNLTDITDEAGSCTLFFLDQVAGYYTDNPGAYDGLCALHYAQVKGLRSESTVDLSQPLVGPHGQYYPGWCYTLRS